MPWRPPGTKQLYSASIKSGRSRALVQLTRQHQQAVPHVYTLLRGLHSGSNVRTGQPLRSDSAAFYKSTLDFPKATYEIRELDLEHLGNDVVLHGYLGARSDVTKSLSFAPLLSSQLHRSVQLVSKADADDSTKEDVHAKFKSLKPHLPVAVRGVVLAKVKPRNPSQVSKLTKTEDVEIKIIEVTVLNDFADDIEFQKDTVISSNQRHLQFRQQKPLRDALAFRSALMQACRNSLISEHGCLEIETPLLFKSTPEGAREFLVPTRVKGQAYALPQSPQQYKQILMASGIPKYFQFARCFRDEDLRADRQPEFTQLDLEMAFSTGRDVIACIESLIKFLWRSKSWMGCQISSDAFPTMAYADAMSKYGSDKPDVRLGMEISRIGHLIPADLTSKIGPLSNPIVDVLKFSVSEDPAKTREFVSRFMDSPEAQTFQKNPDGQPGMFIFDSRKPLGGLSPFGFEAAEHLEEFLKLEEGDLVVLQARKNQPFSGGSTPMGNLRSALHRAAVAYGYVAVLTGWSFLWINEFPMFSPTNDIDPGQGGSAGISSTHHPFTAPASAADFDLLSTRPLEAKADHYDLVLNGIELGGGSRRIHDARIQEYVLRDILKMNDDRLKDFAHLLDALRAGCPPHAGIALGFDRLCAVMLGRDSIRDVIAFPKSGSGQDLMVKSPSPMTKAQLDTYHLQLKT